ncbi:MAG: hypothetical protein HQM11_14225 [SAR324 cluster bacterium]|nr:hypothetical protein [SAR324 cluster bacterium]
MLVFRNIKISENNAFKILAVFLALGIWFQAKRGAETTEMSFFAPIVFKQLPANLIITSDPPPMVNVSALIVTRRGKTFNPNDVQLILDLSNLNSGTFPYDLTTDQVTAPSNIRILSISPAQITIQTEEIIERVIPLKPRYQGQLKQNYVLEKIEVIPDSVTLKGPKSRMQNLSNIFTKEINLQDLNSSIDLIVHLDLPDKTLQIIDTNIDFYTARISVISLPIRRLFNNVPIYLTNATYVSVINPPTFNLQVEGPADIVEHLDPTQIYGVVDLTDYKPGTAKVIPTPVVPKEITIFKQWPPISLWVKRQQISDDKK